MSSSQTGHAHHDHVSAADEPTFPVLDEDENVVPRPEDGIADVPRAELDVEDHSARRL